MSGPLAEHRSDIPEGGAGEHGERAASLVAARVNVVIPALAPASPQIAGHHIVGASTGYMVEDYGDWTALLQRAITTSTLAVELSALSEHELPSLVEFFGAARVLPFVFVSVHAPTKERELPEHELVDILRRVATHVDAIVVHPDKLDDPALYRSLGSILAIENMDRRKTAGRTAEQLTQVFDALPEAGLCFDVPHAWSVDPTLEVAAEILDLHGDRLRHVHLSSLDDDCHHRTLTDADEKQFAQLLDRCRDVPWILEAPPAGQ